MAYYDQDPMGNFTGTYADQEAEAIAQREEEEKKRKEAEERARKENEKLAKERDDLAVHKQEITTYANGSKTITNVAEVPATADAPGRPNVKPVAPQGFQGQTDEFGGVDAAVERQRRMNQQEERQSEQRQQPRAPVAPVAPGKIFERQIQAESGGQHIDPRTGQIMTSPKGALGIAQIMPATARQPGYGIQPISDEELRTPEGNRAFGERYKEGMLRVFNGDEEKATASYNAGPGAVQKAVRRAEQRGGDYKDYLPRETQNYLQKVFGGQAQQQQQQRPQTRSLAPVAPDQGEYRDPNPNAVVTPGTGPRPVANVDITGGAQPAPTGPVPPDDSVINNQVADYERRQAPAAEVYTGQGLRMPGQPSGVPNSARAIDEYQKRQDNIPALMKLGTSDDPEVPSFIKERSRNRAADLITQEREMARAKETVANSSESDIAKYLRKKTEGGSYLKLALYGLLGMENSGMAEAAKLGIGTDKAVMGADGKAYIVKTSANGTPLEGFSGETGKALTAKELIEVAAGSTGSNKVSTSAEQFQDKAGNIYRSQSDEKGRLVTKNIVTGEIYKGDEKLTRVRDVASQTGDERRQGFRRENDATQFGNSIRKLDYAGKLKAVEEFRQAAINRGEPDLSNEELSAMGIDRPDIGATPTKQQTGQAPAKAPKEAIAPTALPAGTQGAAPALPTGPVDPNAPAPAAGTSVTGRITPADQKRREKIEEGNQQVSVDARKDYNAYVDKEVVAKVPNASKISRIRSQQLDGPDGLLAVPEVAGIMSGGGSAGREVGNIIRDMITGQFTSVEDLNKRVVGLGIQNSNPKVYNALMMQIRLQQELGPLTIKETAPVGAISDSEQKMNTSNQVDVTRNPAYVTFNLLSKNKFQTDLTQAKADFAAKNQDLNTIAKFNQAWTKEEGRLYKQYDDIYAARAAYVGEHKNTPLAAAAGYKLFPVPAWNSEKGTFEYKGQPYAKKRPPIDSFVK